MFQIQIILTKKSVCFFNSLVGTVEQEASMLARKQGKSVLLRNK